MLKQTANCPNCGTELRGRFCSTCGQDQKELDRHFFSLLGETLEDVFTPNSRSARTLIALCFRPGLLTREYFAGRKARYIQPVRLYFITSITYFFMISFLAGSGTAIPEGEQPPALDPNSESQIDKLELDFLSDEQSAQLNAKLKEQLDKATNLVTNDPGRARDMAIDAAPPVIFCLLPIFAALLKLLYLGKGRYYTEHLVLALHNHSFIFIALLLGDLIELLPMNIFRSVFEVAVATWFGVYLLMSLKTTYRQGWLLTIFKFFLLAGCYGALFISAAAMTLVVNVLVL